MYFLLSVAVTLCFLPTTVLLAAPMSWAWPVLRAYVAIQLFLLRVICGQKVRVTGAENLGPGPSLIAARHEAMWETLFLPIQLGNPAVMLKQEILTYPLAGPVARKLGYIGIDRSGNLEAAKRSFAQARSAVDAGRRVLIFPSGTRDPARRDQLQAGVAVIYRQLGVPCVPVTLNSGDLWPHRSWLKRPGTVDVRICPPIPPGLKTRDFMARLNEDLGPDTRP
ncbi:lysophospholipid acyltransferase family protein [Psychromarinibacter sp. S121]|uniref:lysophospholipid acyltransferase family protein n=1 Tax=Psychromarinibacter sp. S121 TaxID=3415127 RepID=UPI003C7A3C11